MKQISTIKKLIKRHKHNLEADYNVKSLGIFGSYARGTAKQKSDIDILVDFTEAPDFFTFLQLEYLLEKLLGLKVDLVTRKALKQVIKQDILKETIFI